MSQAQTHCTYIRQITVGLLVLTGCTGTSEPTEVRDTDEIVEASSDSISDLSITYPRQCGGFGDVFDPRDFEILDPFVIDDVFIQRLPQPTPLEEDTLIHVRLPELADRELQGTLVRVVGNEQAPVLLFNSDALAELGAIEKSPGKGFFSAFLTLDKRSLDQRREAEQIVLKNDKLEETPLIFEGRHPMAMTVAKTFDFNGFEAGASVSLGTVNIMPISNATNWGEAVFVTDPKVVKDPSRTYDPCTQAGNECGPWTFCHLMTEMANEPRTGITPQEFTLQWLEQWLKDYTVNADDVEARSQMYDTIIKPWLNASGGHELDLKHAPFRLLAIVNRLDLRKTSAGGFGYGGSAGGVPLDAGELRFVFGVMRPEDDGPACEPLPFTVIFEYGVPRSGCADVKDWAAQWVALDTMGGFGSAYRAQLEDMTESVVTRDLAPDKGNGNAINQLRTNENALDPIWEMREFTLSKQSFTCASFTNVPADGFLRPHTVGETPDDGKYSPHPDPTIDAFLSPTPPCTAPSVPVNFDCSTASPDPFLGGHSQVSLNPGGSPPGSWLATNQSSSCFPDKRHGFSAKTCNGCHACDTGTTFTHVDPMSGIPAQLSGFLTGITVSDTQFPGISRHFADLDRRYNDLYSLHQSLCGPFFPLIPDLIPELPIDILHKPVLELELFREILDLRIEFTDPSPKFAVDSILDDAAMPEQLFVH